MQTKTSSFQNRLSNMRESIKSNPERFASMKENVVFSAQDWKKTDTFNRGG